MREGRGEGEGEERNRRNREENRWWQPNASVFIVQCLVDGPTSDVPRQVINFKRLALTGILVEGKGGNLKSAKLWVNMPALHS